MKFVIRDDDLNYFSTPVDIERWYADVFVHNIPVGFSAIPFLIAGEDAWPITIPSSDTEYPIINNNELIAYVRSNPLIEIMQHGTRHGTESGVFEYQKTSGLIEETQKGKEELQKAFGERFKNIFVPPHDWIGSHGIRAVEAAEMDIIRGRGAGLRNLIWRWQYFVIFLRMLVFKFTHAFQSAIPAYPYVLNFGKHKEACSYRLEDEDVFDGLAYANKKDGIFVVVTHLHFYTEEKKKRLMQLIGKARELSAEFATPSALF